MVHWSGKGKYPSEQERERKRMIREARQREKRQRELQVIKDRLDLFGEDALEPHEVALIKNHHDFFYPGRV